MSGSRSRQLGEAARALRLRKGYTQAEVASLYGFSQAFISTLEQQPRNDLEAINYLEFVGGLKPQDHRTAGGNTRVGRKREAVLPELNVLESERELRTTRTRLETIVRAAAEKPRRMDLGHQGNTFQARVYLIPSLDLWTAFYDGEAELWNTYGLGDPFDRPTDRNMVCHLSVPAEGIDRRIGAAYAQSRNGSTFVLHRGRIGGGRVGVGKSAFFAHYEGKLAQAQDGRRVSEFALVGRIDDPRFLSHVRDFVRVVRKIKAQITGR